MRIRVALFVMVAACTASVLVGVAVAGGTAHGGPTGTAAVNRLAAVRDARGRLARLSLPPGAVALSREPAGDDHVLDQPASRPATPNLVDLHAYWRVPDTPEALLRFVGAHPPSQAKQTLSGMTAGGGRPPTELLGFDWADIAGVVASRSLVMQVVGLPDGSSAVRADAQAVWITPRPASERIPPGVREIDITRRLGHVPSVSIEVRDQEKAKEIVSLIDQLPSVQPGSWACPAERPGQPLVKFVFRGPNRAVLAVASEPADVTEPTTPCDPLTLTINGRPRMLLLRGAVFLRRTDQLLGVTLVSSP